MGTRTDVFSLSKRRLSLLTSCFLVFFLFNFLFLTRVQANPRISFSSEWLNRYVGVVGVPAYEKPVLTSTVFVRFDAGYYGGVFYATDVADLGQGGFSTTWGDELDWFIGWQGKVFGDFRLKTQVVYLDFLRCLMNKTRMYFVLS